MPKIPRIDIVARGTRTAGGALRRTTHIGIAPLSGTQVRQPRANASALTRPFDELADVGLRLTDQGIRALKREKRLRETTELQKAKNAFSIFLAETESGFDQIEDYGNAEEFARDSISKKYDEFGKAFSSDSLREQFEIDTALPATQTVLRARAFSKERLAVDSFNQYRDLQDQAFQYIQTHPFPSQDEIDAVKKNVFDFERSLVGSGALKADKAATLHQKFEDEFNSFMAERDGQEVAREPVDPTVLKGYLDRLDRNDYKIPPQKQLQLRSMVLGEIAQEATARENQEEKLIKGKSKTLRFEMMQTIDKNPDLVSPSDLHKKVEEREILPEDAEAVQKYLQKAIEDRDKKADELFGSNPDTLKQLTDAAEFPTSAEQIERTEEALQRGMLADPDDPNYINRTDGKALASLIRTQKTQFTKEGNSRLREVYKLVDSRFAKEVGPFGPIATGPAAELAQIVKSTIRSRVEKGDDPFQVWFELQGKLKMGIGADITNPVMEFDPDEILRLQRKTENQEPMTDGERLTLFRFNQQEQKKQADAETKAQIDQEKLDKELAEREGKFDIIDSVKNLFGFGDEQKAEQPQQPETTAGQPKKQEQVPATPEIVAKIKDGRVEVSPRTPQKVTDQPSKPVARIENRVPVVERNAVKPRVPQSVQLKKNVTRDQGRQQLHSNLHKIMKETIALPDSGKRQIFRYFEDQAVKFADISPAKQKEREALKPLLNEPELMKFMMKAGLGPVTFYRLFGGNMTPEEFIKYATGNK